VKRSIILLLILFNSCALNVYVKDNFKRSYDFSQIKALAILPFMETFEDTSWQYFVPVSKSKLNYEAADIIAMELFDTGIKIVDRVFLERIVQEQRLSLTGLLEQENYEKIGKLANVDAILWGIISLSKAVGSRKVRVSVRLIDIKTGTVIYTASATKGDIWGGLSPAGFTKGVLIEMTNKLKKVLLMYRGDSNYRTNEMHDKWGKLFVIVKDIEGNPIYGTTIKISQNSREIKREYTDKKGVCEISYLPQGNYEIKIWKQGYIAVQKNIGIISKKTLEVTLFKEVTFEGD